MNTSLSLRIKSLSLLLLMLMSVVIAPRTQANATSQPDQPAVETHQVFLPIVLRDATTNPPPDGEFTFLALSDANIVFAEGPALTSFLQSQKMLLCDFNPPVPTNPQTYDQALASVWTYLNGHVGANNLATYRTLPEAETADTNQAFAVAALANHRPDGALTAFLIAAEQSPNDPMILVNTAGVLNMLSMPNEALAFLDHAQTLSGELVSPMNISGAQIAQNNRGHALMGLGQWANAENILRPVVEAESQLSEARTNLSIALLCQEKYDEAGYFYRLGARRHLYDAVIDGEEIGGHLPVDMLYDRSAGRILNLPGIPFAGTIENTADFIPIYNQIENNHLARYTQKAEQLDNVFDQIIARQPTLPFLTNIRYANVIGAINSATSEPDILTLQQAFADADAELGQVYQQNMDDLEALGNENLPLDEYYPACQALLSSGWNSVKIRLQGYEDTSKEYAEALYAEQTGLAANLLDPLHHEAGSLIAEKAAESVYGDIVGNYSVYNTGYAALWAECLGGATPTTPTNDDPEYEQSEACPEFVKGVKLAVKIAGLSIGVNCEQIELGASTPEAMGLFGDVTVDFKKDTVTAFVGAIVQTPGSTNLNAKEGLYITANKGGLTDAGMKVSTGGTLGVGAIAGQIDGPGFEFSVVSAMQYITGN